MKAIIVKQPGGAEQLRVSEQPKPVPKSDELLIKVKAAAINRTDIIHRESESGYLDMPILGIEVAGIVVESDDSNHLPVGTNVMGLVNSGGYAEYAVMPVERAITIPDNLSFEEAAAIPEVFLTAYQTLYWHGKLEKRETVLIHAAGSGVGTAAIQLAKHLSDANILATAGTKEKLDFATKLGADIGINYKEQNFAEEIAKVTDERGTDVILDFIGASYWEKNLQSIAVDGRWILIGILGGTKVAELNLWDIMAKRIQLIGTLLTPRSNQYKADLTKEFIEVVLPLFENETVKPIIDSVFSLEEIQQAHKRMESNQNIGKIIVKMN